MFDYSSITAPRDVENACLKHHLIEIFIIPAELGGRDVPQNLLYVPPAIRVSKDDATVELLHAVQMGMIEVAIRPEYRGVSLVPSKIIITAARPGMPPGYQRDIEIW